MQPTAEEMEAELRWFVRDMEAAADEREHVPRYRCGNCGGDTWWDTMLGSPRCCDCERILVYKAVRDGKRLDPHEPEWVPMNRNWPWSPLKTA